MYCQERDTCILISDVHSSHALLEAEVLFSQHCASLSANEVIPHFKNNYPQDEESRDEGVQNQEVCCESGRCTRADPLNELSSLAEGAHWVGCHRTIGAACQGKIHIVRCDQF